VDCAYLLAETPEERAWLASCSGLETDFGGVNRLPQQLTLDEATLGALADRTDGVALLAEALSHAHATGRFHELIRVFERAFALGPYDLIEPLTVFLQGGRFGFTGDEVRSWIERRQPATHADRRQEFVLEAGIRPVVARMEQAAYDVLLNKASWRNRSPERREAWHPKVGTTTPTGDFFMTKGMALSLETQALDAFRAYPLNLAASGVPNIPPEWWPQPVVSEDASGSDQTQGQEAEQATE
jgi:hypothetical protein